MKGAKGCADLITKIVSRNEYNETQFKVLIEESNILLKNKNQENYQDILTSVLKKLKFIFKKKSSLIKVYNLDDESENFEEIAYIILKAFLDSQKNSCFEILKLAMEWNRVDLVIRNDVFANSESLEPYQMEKLLEIALIENKPEFVKLLLENGSNLESFLTYGRFYYLYNSKLVIYYILFAISFFF